MELGWNPANRCRSGHVNYRHLSGVGVVVVVRKWCVTICPVVLSFRIMTNVSISPAGPNLSKRTSMTRFFFSSTVEKGRETLHCATLGDIGGRELNELINVGLVGLFRRVHLHRRRSQHLPDDPTGLRVSVSHNRRYCTRVTYTASSKGGELPVQFHWERAQKIALSIQPMKWQLLCKIELYRQLFIDFMITISRAHKRFKVLWGAPVESDSILEKRPKNNLLNNM